MPKRKHFWTYLRSRPAHATVADQRSVAIEMCDNPGCWALRSAGKYAGASGGWTTKRPPCPVKNREAEDA